MSLPLTVKNLHTVAATSGPVADLPYCRDEIRPGILHFGVGNFHRCHQAVYADKLLREGYLDYGIVGVSMRSSAIRDQLAPQDYLYTELTLGKKPEFQIIGSILDIMVAPECPDAVIKQLANPEIQLVTMTITEKGYCLNSGQVDVDHNDFLSDMTSLEQPHTIYGYLAAGLNRRRENSGTSLTILCCDNVQGGGSHLARGVNYLLKEHHPKSLAWATDNVSFASSMVDRVCPATDKELREKVISTTGLKDNWPVSAEPFSQWVIEDNFAGSRPPFDKVGAVFSNDIALFEQMKLRFLNAGHSATSVMGYLADLTTVHDALNEVPVLHFLETMLRECVLPIAVIPATVNAEEYIQQILERFKNAALPYTVQQVNTDSSQKIQQRWFPTIDEALSQHVETGPLSLCLAAWIAFVQKALVAHALQDPLAEKFGQISDSKPVNRELIQHFLLIAGAERFDFISNEAFMGTVLNNYETITSTSIINVLEQRENKANA